MEDVIITGGSFESCPKELLILIFEYLNVQSLLACRAVNRIWRDIADYCGECHNKWIQLRDCMYNRGVSFEQRSKLSYKDLYINSCMWKFIHKAQYELKYVYDINNVQKIHVYRDTLIVVCKESVKFFNLDDGKLTNKIFGVYLDYQETDFLISKVNVKEGKKNLSVHSKRHHKTYESQGFTIYTVRRNKCFFSDEHNRIDYYECTPNEFKQVVLSRFYSSPRLLYDMFIYEDEMYIYITRGDVFCHKNGEFGLKQVCGTGVPSSVPPNQLICIPPTCKAIFHKYSVVYGVHDKNEEQIFTKPVINNFDDKDQLMLLYADLTCAVEHGDILVLGFKNGKVGIVIASRLWATKDLNPVYEFFIQDLSQVEDTEPIKALEVYEADGCHHILVVTTKIYQVVISQSDYTKVIP